MVKYAVMNVYTQATRDYNAEKTFFRRCVISVSDGTIAYSAQVSITPDAVNTELTNYGTERYTYTTAISDSTNTPLILNYKYQQVLYAIPMATVSIDPVSSAVYWRIETLDGSWVFISEYANKTIQGNSGSLYHNGTLVLDRKTFNDVITGSGGRTAPLPLGNYYRLYTGTFDSDGNLTAMRTCAQIGTTGGGLNNVSYRAGGSGMGGSDGVIALQFYNALLLNEVPPEPTPPGSDPYDDIDPSEPGSGDGTFDFTDSDPIDFGNLPALSAVSTGFISLWCPDNTQINKLASFMWNTSGSIINFLKNLIADPLDLIMGLHIVPLEVTPVGTDTVTVGLINTGVEMDYIESQWAVVDCGTLNINETWGAYLDYDPYTKMEIYLPYCGTHPLRVDDFMTGTMQVVYNVDLMSGSCVAMIKNSESVLYTFMGQCATDIPVTAEQYGNIFKSITQLGANIGETAAAGPVAIPGAVSSAVDTVMGLKPSIGRSGAIGGAAGLMCPQKPYITMTRPRQAHPENQNTYMGYPAIFTASLADLTGYTEIQSIHLHGITGTQAEVDELENLLKSGVIF